MGRAGQEPVIRPEPAREGSMRAVDKIAQLKAQLDAERRIGMLRTEIAVATVIRDLEGVPPKAERVLTIVRHADILACAGGEAEVQEAVHP